MASVPKFAAHRSLGRLARWLRRLGFDTVCRSDLDAHALARLAVAEERIVLTRSSTSKRNEPAAERLVLRAADFRSQLREIDAVHALGGWEDRQPRCLSCNGTLRPGSAADSSSAPERLRWRCIRCRRESPAGRGGGRMGAELRALSLREPDRL